MAIWKVLLGIGWGKAQLSGGHFDVLLGEGVGDIQRSKATGGEAIGIEPETHGVLALAEDDNGADTGYTLESIADVDVEVVRDEGLG